MAKVTRLGSRAKTVSKVSDKEKAYRDQQKDLNRHLESHKELDAKERQGYTRVVSIACEKNGNPKRRKNSGEIKRMLDSPVFSFRAHAYCQPEHCAYYGVAKNCDSSFRENGTQEAQTIWLSEGTTRQGNIYNNLKDPVGDRFYAENAAKKKKADRKKYDK